MFGTKRIAALEKELRRVSEERIELSYKVVELKTKLQEVHDKPGEFVNLLKELKIHAKPTMYSTPENAAKYQIMDMLATTRDAAKDVAELYHLMQVKNLTDAKVKVLSWRGAEATMAIFAKAVASYK